MVKQTPTTDLCKPDGSTMRQCGALNAPPWPNATEDKSNPCHDNDQCCPSYPEHVHGICYARPILHVVATASSTITGAGGVPNWVAVTLYGNVTNYTGSLVAGYFVPDGNFTIAGGKTGNYTFSSGSQSYQRGTSPAYYALAVMAGGNFTSGNYTFSVPQRETLVVTANATQTALSDWKYSLSITANASGTPDTTDVMRIFLDGAELAADSNIPYSATSGLMAAGTNHTYSARLSAYSGNFSSPNYTVTFPPRPAPSVTAAAAPQPLADGRAGIGITAIVNGSVASSDEMHFLVDGTDIGSDRTQPYSFLAVSFL